MKCSFVLNLYLILATSLLAQLPEPFTDHFDDGDLDGWLKYDLEALQDPVKAATFDLSEGCLRLQAGPGLFQFNRRGLMRSEGEYTDFHVQVDVVNINIPLAHALYARISDADDPDGFGRGYSLLLNPQSNRFELWPADWSAANNGGGRIGKGEFEDVQILDIERLRLIFQGRGTKLTAIAYDLDDLTEPLGEFHFEDDQFPSGRVGFGGLTTGGASMDSCFDNFIAYDLSNPPKELGAEFDAEGIFVRAIDIGGEGNVALGDAQFTSEAVTPLANIIGGEPATFDSIDTGDPILNGILATGRPVIGDDPVILATILGLTFNSDYKVQLLVSGELSSLTIQGQSIQITEESPLITHEFTAQGPALSVVVEGSNAVLHGLTLEKIGDQGLTEDEEIVPLDPAMGQIPEGVTIDGGGNVYVGLAPLATLVKVEGGKVIPIGRVEGVIPPGDNGMLGLTSDARGHVYAAVAAESLDARGVWKFDPATGEKVRLPGTEAIPFPNTLTFDEAGTLYISSSTGEGMSESGEWLGAIWRVSPGGVAERWHVEVMLGGTGQLNPFPLGINGMAYRNGALYAVNSEKAIVLRLPLLENGDAGRSEIIAGGAAFLLSDGLAFDGDGNLYVTSINQSAIVRILHDGTTEQVATAGDGLDYPSNVAVKASESGNGLELYAVNLALGVSFGLPPGTGPALVKLPLSRRPAPLLPRLTAITQSGESVQLHLSSGPTSLHARLETSDDLAGWRPMTSATLTVTDQRALYEIPRGDTGDRYYRLTQ